MSSESLYQYQHHPVCYFSVILRYTPFFFYSNVQWEVPEILILFSLIVLRSGSGWTRSIGEKTFCFPNVTCTDASSECRTVKIIRFTELSMFETSLRTMDIKEKNDELAGEGLGQEVRIRGFRERSPFIMVSKSKVPQDESWGPCVLSVRPLGLNYGFVINPFYAEPTNFILILSGLQGREGF